MSSDPVIEIRNLGKRYEIYPKPQDRLSQAFWRGKRCFYKEFWALRNVSLEVQKGEVVGVIGANGSGKSTLLQLIAGTLSSTEGEATVRGNSAALLELGSGFNPLFTGRENVFLNGAILGIPERRMQALFSEIEDFADLGEFINRPVRIYSKGMLMRLGFAVAAAVSPEVLIIDEILAVGDASFQFKCADRLERLLQSGTTLLLASHDVGVIKKFCHRVLYLCKGRVKALGLPEEVIEQYALDVRNEQMAKRNGAVPIFTPKIFAGGENGIAFGTEEGRILSALFKKSGGLHSIFVSGEKVELTVEAEFLPSVQNPCLSVMVQDKKTLRLGGTSFQISKKQADNGWCRSRLTCAFPAKFSDGRYFVTLRLENRQSDRVFVPIDKQVSLLSFDALPASAERSFLGPVDLDIKFVEHAE